MQDQDQQQEKQVETAEEHYEALYRFALSLSKRPAEAKDLVQQTYWQWVKNRDAIRDEAKIKSWLFTTLYREFLRGKKRDERMVSSEEATIEHYPPTMSTNPGQALDGTWAMSMLQQVPEPFREALSLFYVEDFSYAEIAHVLEISPGTVMSRIFRGKQILRTKVQELGIQIPATAHLKLVK